MSDDTEGIFAEVRRIEEEAEQLLAQARSDAADAARRAEDDVRQLAAETDGAIEKANADLAAEYQSRTEQALSHIDVEFLKQEETLETVREKRFDELVNWTASRITERQMATGD